MTQVITWCGLVVRLQENIGHPVFTDRRRGRFWTVTTPDGRSGFAQEKDLIINQGAPMPVATIEAPADLDSPAQPFVHDGIEYDLVMDGQAGQDF